ncbi:MAG: hypothetical protein LBF40_06600 [Deltaproteobacteria bacterium]|nr:hypothetical protein [Deltaproteobacteria bacterium]
MERPNRETRVGGGIEAYCTKCRRDTGHVIVTMEAGAPKRVQCEACGGQHNYRPPKTPPAKAPAPKAAPKVRKSRAKPKGKEEYMPAPGESRSEAAERIFGSPEKEAPRPDHMKAMAEDLRGIASDPKAPKPKKPAAKAKAPAAKAKGAAGPPAKNPLRGYVTGEGDEDAAVGSDLESGMDDFDDEFGTDPFVGEPAPKPKPKPRAKPAAKAPGRAQTLKKTKEQKRQDDLREQHSLEWAERTRGVNPDKAAPYRVTGSYDFDQPIRHDVFGVGYVTRVVPPNKIHVKFKEETKILITNVPEGGDGD